MKIETEWRAAERQQIRRLRLVSTTEGLTLVTLVLIAVPAKHIFGLPIATRLMGPVHGLAFLAYLWTLIATVPSGSWSKKEMAQLVLAAFMPFGFLGVSGLLRRKEATA